MLTNIIANLLTVLIFLIIGFFGIGSMYLTVLSRKDKEVK